MIRPSAERCEVGCEAAGMIGLMVLVTGPRTGDIMALEVNVAEACKAALSSARGGM